MNTREMIVAGQFYPQDKQDCIETIENLLAGAEEFETELAQDVSCAIVPHAGWLFSGDLCAAAFKAIKESNSNIDTFILLGAAHRMIGAEIAVFDGDSWNSPLGKISIDKNLCNEIINSNSIAMANTSYHRNEHSIEVIVPFIQYLFDRAEIVPIIVPPTPESVGFGKGLANIIASQNKKIAIIASTDLTHYGPSYGFETQENIDDGLRWAKEVNDKIFIDHALKFEAQELLESSLENSNACGAGAAAALVSCAAELGITNATLLAHKHSYEVMKKKFARNSKDTVGYASIVY